MKKKNLQQCGQEHLKSVQGTSEVTIVNTFKF